jgi:hypothetical protein
VTAQPSQVLEARETARSDARGTAGAIEQFNIDKEDTNADGDLDVYLELGESINM